MKHFFKLFFIILFFISFSLKSETNLENSKYVKAREQMVNQQIKGRGIIDPWVVDAMKKVPRHLFVPDTLAKKAYGDHPLPIGEGQTISQPYIVALMTESIGLSGSERILEIGTGSGYQSAVLSRIVREVFSIEIKENLYKKSTQLLESLYPGSVKTLATDGYFGWKEKSPFDCIMITAAIDHIPPPLLEQLKDGGRLILPLGNPFSYQNLVLVTKNGDDFTVEQVTGVLFVPMTGHALNQ